MPNLPVQEIRGDGPCDDCGGENIIWFTLNVLWNEVREKQEKLGNESYSIVCVTCFVKRAAAVGIKGGWLVIPGWPL